MSTVEKATDVLFFLATRTAACGVSDVAQGVGVPKTSAHRLLQSLRYKDLVQGDSGGRYRLGAGLVELGLSASTDERIVRAAREPMQQQAADLGETFFLVCSRGGELVVVDKAEGSGFLRASPRVGSTVPAHATAVGRLFLAFDRDRVEEGPRQRFTKSTPTSARDVDRLVRLAREQGVAVSKDEWVEGLAAVAAPVLVAGRMLGAIAVASSSPRLVELGVDRVVRAAVAAAKVVSVSLEGASV